MNGESQGAVRYKLPFSRADLGEEEMAAVLDVLKNRVLALGPQTEEFERRVASYVGARHGVAVSSGTAALHLCVAAAHVGEGDEVITTPFSFVASANCLLYERARPVFVDIDPVSLNLDPARIESAIRPSTRAILVVHIFGQPADMDAILDIARRRRLLVLEDACEAIGAEYHGRRVGTFGRAGTFAFFPNKQMTSGEGGMIVTDDDNWARLFRSLRNQGRDAGDGWLQHSRLGYNYRMTEMSAALGRVQISRIEELLSRRNRVASWYSNRLKELDGLTLPQALPETRLTWFVYLVRLDAHFSRDRIRAHLEAAGIPTRDYFAPIHLQRFYRKQFGYEPGDFPITEKIAASTLALPFHGGMVEGEVELVCQTLRAAIQRG